MEGVRALLATESADPMPIMPQAFDLLIEKDKARWEAVIRAVKVTVE